MERELAQLRDIFNRVNLQGGYKGCSVFVYGPKRSGKSSLVLYFYREIQRLHSQKCLLVYYEASRRQSWKGAEKELNRQICEHAVQMAPFFNIELPPLSDLSLVENMEILQRVLHIPFVLIIDEAIGLLHETTAAEEMESLLDFFDCVAKLPQRMVIWGGRKRRYNFYTQGPPQAGKSGTGQDAQFRTAGDLCLVAGGQIQLSPSHKDFPFTGTSDPSFDRRASLLDFLSRTFDVAIRPPG